VILTSLQKNSLLVDYWRPTFPRGGGDLPFWLGRTAQSLADEPLRLVVPLLALLLVVVGTAHLAWRQRWSAAVALASCRRRSWRRQRRRTRCRGGSRCGWCRSWPSCWPPPCPATCAARRCRGCSPGRPR
jgi:hypothetical protein